MKQFLLLLSAVIVCKTSSAAVWYVNLNAGGSNDGSSWANAYTDLQSAFSSATAGDSIWVAKGTYKPTSGTTRTIYFRLKNGVSIFGGFAGNETSVNNRNINSNLTILSGDIGNAGSASDNTYHVVYGSNISSTVIVDGFRITGGNYGYGSEGAGMYLDNCKIIIRNTHITDNSSGFGGGIYQYNGSLEIINCRINDNVASSHTGAAIYCKGTGGSISVVNTQFRNNVVDPSASAGILFVSGEFDLLVDRCEFSGNHAKSWGIISTSSKKTCKIINTVIVGNYCREAKYISNSGTSGSDFSVINCTIADNHADSNQIKQGNYPAIYVPNTLNTRVVRNCIIYNNTSSVDFSNGLTVSNCILSKTYSNATKSMLLNPLFTNPGNKLNAPFIYSGLSYELNIRSAAIDKADDAFLSSTDSLDFSGKQRKTGISSDIGALERPYCLMIPGISAGGPREICSGDTLKLYADSGNYWTWNNGSNSRTLNVSTTGKYSVVSIDTISGCRGIASDSVTVHSAPVKINGNLRFCNGDSSLLTAVGNGISFTWNNADTGKTFKVFTGGKYLLEGITDQGCIGKDSVVVIIDTLPLPAVLISESSGVLNNDAVLCKGAGITLTASGGVSYLWSDSSVNAQLIKTPLADAVYAVRVKNARGCVKWSQPLTVMVKALPVAMISVTEQSGNADSDGIICSGDSIILTSNTQFKYSWSTGSKMQTQRLKLVNSATYILTATDSNGCQATASVNVTVNPLPLPVISKVNHNLQTGSFISYQWYLNDTLIPGANNNSYHPLSNGKYTVEVENSAGCSKRSAPYDFKTGLDAISFAKFSFYPQPLQDKLNIASDYPGEYTLSVYNSLGVPVYTGLLVNEAGLDVSGWTPGVYFIQILNMENQLIGIYRLVKM